MYYWPSGCLDWLKELVADYGFSDFSQALVYEDIKHIKRIRGEIDTNHIERFPSQVGPTNKLLEIAKSLNDDNLIAEFENDLEVLKNPYGENPHKIE